MAERAIGTPQATLERDWWLRALVVLTNPRSVFVALRDDSRPAAEARQEPVLALVLLAGMAAVLATPSTADLLDDGTRDGIVVAVLIFLAGGLYGAATYLIGGGALAVGIRAAGGESTYRAARHLVAFAAAPLALSLFVLWPLELAVFGSDLFRTGGGDETGAGRWVFQGLEAAFVAWAAALLVLGVVTVHAWPLVRALGAVVLAGLALLAVAVAFSLFG
jgi:hypothetical protein